MKETKSKFNTTKFYVIYFLSFAIVALIMVNFGLIKPAIYLISGVFLLSAISVIGSKVSEYIESSEYKIKQQKKEIMKKNKNLLKQKETDLSEAKKIEESIKKSLQRIGNSEIEELTINLKNKLFISLKYKKQTMKDFKALDKVLKEGILLIESYSESIGSEYEKELYEVYRDKLIPHLQAENERMKEVILTLEKDEEKRVRELKAQYEKEINTLLC